MSLTQHIYVPNPAEIKITLLWLYKVIFVLTKFLTERPKARQRWGALSPVDPIIFYLQAYIKNISISV